MVAESVRDKYNTLMEAQTLAMENANNAYKTAGMSANTYMETITSFAASLKQSTEDEVQAAEVADMAIQDMSDNASKMGTNMQSIRDAYQGFSKQNYEMLDNLKLGYGGTKTEMERLLADAEELSGVKYDISNLADVYNAIHVIQENLGITGTTAQEAMYTIEGSANMTKAAWENVLIAIGKGEGLSEAIDGLVLAIFGDESGGGFLNNIIPRIQTVMVGIGDFISSAAPYFINRIPELINSLLPGLISASMSLIETVASALPGAISLTWGMVTDLLNTLYGYLQAEGPQVLLVGQELFGNLVNAILGKLPEIMTAGGDVVSNLVQGLYNSFPTILQTGVSMLSTLVQGIINNLPAITSSAAEILAKLISTIGSNLPTVLQQGIEITASLVAGLIQAIPQVIAAIPSIISGIVEEFSKYDWASIGMDILSGIAKGLINGVSVIVDAAKNAARQALNAAKNFLQIKSPSRVFRDQVGKMISLGMGVGIEDNAPVKQAVDTVSRVMSGAREAVSAVEIPLISSYKSGDVGVLTPVGPGKYVYDGSDLISSIMEVIDYEFNRLIGVLEVYLPQFANTQLVMDTGALVGELVPTIDYRLGEMLNNKDRGN